MSRRSSFMGKGLLQEERTTLSRAMPGRYRGSPARRMSTPSRPGRIPIPIIQAKSSRRLGIRSCISNTIYNRLRKEGHMGHDTHIALFIAIGLVSGLGSCLSASGAACSSSLPSSCSPGSPSTRPRARAGRSCCRRWARGRAGVLPPRGRGPARRVDHRRVPVPGRMDQRTHRGQGPGRRHEALLLGVFPLLLGIYLIISAFRNLPV